MEQRQVKVTNPLGVHARPSAKIVQLASGFRSSVSLAINGHRANARNIVAVMSLSASVGSTVTVETSGPDETEAANALANLIGGRFAEARAPVHRQVPTDFRILGTRR
jgi:phosphocarrier protein HPr